MGGGGGGGGGPTFGRGWGGGGGGGGQHQLRCIKANLRYLTAATVLVILLKPNPNPWNHPYSARVTLKFDRWPPKTIENLFHVSKSYVCHLIAIREFKLELSSRNAPIGAKSAIFRPVILTFDGWPGKTIGHFYVISSFVHHSIAIREFRLELQSINARFESSLFCPCDLGIWQMT